MTLRLQKRYTLLQIKNSFHLILSGRMPLANAQMVAGCKLQPLWLQLFAFML